MAAYDPTQFMNLGLSAFQNTQKPFDPTYLDNVSKSLYDQANYNYNTNLRPGLNANAITAGGYGGDRAKLAEGVVMDRMGQNVTNAMAPMYAQGYENSMNRALQGGQGAASTGMGLENLGLGYYGADINNALGQGNLALGRYNADTNRQLGMGNLDVNKYQADTQRQLGTTGANTAQYSAETARNLGMGNLYNDQYRNQIVANQSLANIANPQYTNPWAAAIGGGLTLAQLFGLG